MIPLSVCLHSNIDYLLKTNSSMCVVFKLGISFLCSTRGLVFFYYIYTMNMAYQPTYCRQQTIHKSLGRLNEMEINIIYDYI